jgi:hypothetical protein
MSRRVGVLWLAGREVAVGVAERARGEGSASRATRAPTGMADQASTPAMLMTRPSRWLGTICWRRLAVLMLKKIPRPETAAHSTSATQYQWVAANTTVSSPSTARAPEAATLNESRRRTGPAASDSSTTRALPAA